MNALKLVEYPGFSPRYNGRVAYLVRGREVYFTSAISHKKNPTSTINAAEDVILAIAQAENLDWRMFTFHDIQTCLGYGGHPKTWWVIDQVIFQDAGDRPGNLDWQSVARGPVPHCAGMAPDETVERMRDELAKMAAEENKKLRGVHPDVLEAFSAYLTAIA